MGFVWNWYGFLGVSTALIAWTLAVIIFRAHPHRWQNRYLALLLALDGAIFFGGGGSIYFSDDPDFVYAGQAVTDVVVLAAGVAYLLFLSTLETPMMRPLAAPAGQWTLRVLLLTVPVFSWLMLDQFVAGVEPVSYAAYDSVAGPWRAAVRYTMAAISFLGLLVAWHTWYGARPGSSVRHRSAFYIGAFGIRDVGFIAGQIVFATGFVDPLAGVVLIDVIALVFMGAVAYGILKHQLFDIDLKLKLGLSRTTVAAIFAGAVFVVSEAVEQLFDVDQFIPAIITAGIIALALKPIQWVANRFADRVMPNVDDTPAYRRKRSREVYQAALEGAALDGEITTKERDMLARLQRELGIKVAEAKRMERAVLPA